MLNPCLFIGETELMGRGVFTNKRLPVDLVIEIAPVIVLSNEERIHIDKTLLHDYIFEWGNDQAKCCMALGFVPMYNHSYRSNCDYIMNYEDNSIAIQTVRIIEAGEELTINYNGEWNDDKKLWFDAK